MTSDIAWQELLDLQDEDGSFPSRVQLGGEEHIDHNGFVTALVLRSLPDDARFDRVVERAIHFLERCESSHRPGAYGFWPEDGRPTWAPVLPPDADDTAVVAIELARRDRLDLASLRRIALRVLLPARLPEVQQPAPPWIVKGVFRTWLDPRAGANPIDCAVNANVVALFAAAKLRHLPGYSEVCGMIHQAVAWASGSEARFRSLTPFYAHPLELVSALEHAVDHGAEELWPVLAGLGRELEDLGLVSAGDHPVCSNAYGRVVWHSSAVTLARRLAGSASAHSDSSSQAVA